MFKRFIYLILFLSLSGLLFANEQKRASLSLKPPKGIRTTANTEKNNIPPSADDFFTIDFRTNYYFARALSDEQNDYSHLSTYPHALLKENTLSDLFVQKSVIFFSSQCIYLLNCIWLI